MAANVRFVPPRVPLVDIRTGQITREWYLLFQAAFESQIGGGPIPDPSDDDQLPFFASPSQRTDDLDREIVPQPAQGVPALLTEVAVAQAIQSQQVDYRSKVDELSALVVEQPSRDIHARIDEIELMAAGLIPSQSGLVLAAGTYTPTLSNLGNVASSTAQVCQYLRVGNVCVVSGSATVAATAVALVILGISFPFATTVAVPEVAAGNGNNGGAAQTAAICGNGAGVAQMAYTPISTASIQMFFNFTYRIV